MSALESGPAVWRSSGRLGDAALERETGGAATLFGVGLQDAATTYSFTDVDASVANWGGAGVSYAYQDLTLTCLDHTNPGATGDSMQLDAFDGAMAYLWSNDTVELDIVKTDESAFGATSLSVANTEHTTATVDIYGYDGSGHQLAHTSVSVSNWNWRSVDLSGLSGFADVTELQLTSATAVSVENLVLNPALAEAAPTLTTSGGSLTTAKAVAVQVDPGVTVADADNATLASAKVWLASGFHAGEDVLALAADGGAMGNISGSYDTSTGALTLTSEGATATVAEWQAALRAVTYEDTADAPHPGDRTIDFTVNDGTFDSAAAGRTVSVTATFDAPVLSGGPGSITAAEQTSTAVVPDLAISDDDSSKFTKATLTFDSGYVQGEDMLSLAPDPATMGDISTGGINLDVGDLVINSQSGATAAQWEAALRAVEYYNFSDGPHASIGLSITLTDSSGVVSQPLTETIDVTPVNDPPVLDFFPASSSPVVYLEGTPAAVAPAAQVSDPDSADFGGGALTVRFLSNSTPTDQLSILDAGTGVGEIGVSGSDVTYGGVVIGQVSGGADGSNLVVSLNDEATQAAAEALLRAVAFSSTSENPGGGARWIYFTLSDGDGGPPGADTGFSYSYVHITGVNDAPIVTLAGGLAYTENGSPAAIAPSASVTDVDSADFNGGSLTVEVTADGDGRDQLSLLTDAGVSLSGDVVSVGGVEVGSIDPIHRGEDGNSLVIDFDSSAATAAAVSTLMQHIGYANSSDDPSTLARTVSFTVVDGDGVANGGADTGSDTAQVSVAAIDDPATLRNDSFAADAAAAIGAGLNLFDDNGSGPDSDPDSALQVTAVEGQAQDVGVAVQLASGARITVNADGTFDYDPNGAFDRLVASSTGARNTTATDTFTYSDGSSTATVTVTIAGVDADGRLVGDATHQTLTGGSGDDVLLPGRQLSAGSRLDGGGGGDVLRLKGPPSHFTFGPETLTSVEAIGLTHGSYDLTMDDGNVAAGHTLFVNAGTLDASHYLYLDASAETDGAYRIVGGAGADSLAGGSGADLFDLARGGMDTASGGGGDDRFQLDASLTAADRIDGGAGDDTVVLDGDYPSLVLDPQTLTSVERIVLSAGHGYDITGADMAVGGMLLVNGSRLGVGDHLDYDGSQQGRAGLHLIGGEGADTLTADAGHDLLAGGGGDDVFQFTGIAPGVSAMTNHILDFSPGDVIDLSDIDANAATPGDDAFILGGPARHAGSLVIAYDAVHDRTVLHLYVDDGHSVDARIVLSGDHADLSAADFVL